MVPGRCATKSRCLMRAIGDEEVQAAAELVGLHETIMGLDRDMTRYVNRKSSLRDSGSFCLSQVAVAGEPRILLLDEITANLDADTEEMVLRALKSALRGGR